MGTRSRIGVMHGDKCKSVYCHWDGYLSHNGAILQEHYDSAKANHLVALGNISSLNAQIEIPQDVEHDFDNPTEGITVFYGRDRGEAQTEFAVDFTFEEFFDRVENSWGEWYYVMRDGTWYVGNTYDRDTKFYKQLVPLAEALETVKELA